MDKGPMNIDTLFKSQPQPTIRVEPGDHAFDAPSVNAQAAAVGCPSFDRNRYAPAPRQPKALAVRLRVVDPIALKLIQTSSGTTHLTGNRSNRLNQRNQLRHIVTVASVIVTAGEMPRASVSR
jgi:hypothetical protein